VLGLALRSEVSKTGAEVAPIAAAFRRLIDGLSFTEIVELGAAAESDSSDAK